MLSCPSSICSSVAYQPNPIYASFEQSISCPYVPARVTRGVLVVHIWHLFTLSRYRTSQYCRVFVPLSVSLWNDLIDIVFDGVRLAGFQSRANAFLLA